MPDEEYTVGSNPNEPRPERPTTSALSVEQTETGQKVTKRSRKIVEDQVSGNEIESVTLEKDGRQFTIAKSVYDTEMAKPETREEIKAGEPIYLRNPDLIGAKLVK
jgi:hypothetical protein